jgi:hypothetical protein
MKGYCKPTLDDSTTKFLVESLGCLLEAIYKLNQLGNQVFSTSRRKQLGRFDKHFILEFCLYKCIGITYLPCGPISP